MANSPESIMKMVLHKVDKKACSNFALIFFTGILVNLGQFIYQGGNGDTVTSSICQPGFGWECMLGRWMIQYVGRMRNGVVIPIMLEISAIIFLTAALILLFHIFGITRKFYIFLGACLFFAQPYVSFMLHIYYCADAYSLSIFFAVLSAWLLLCIENKWKYCWSVLFIAVSLSLYQSSISLTGIIVLVHLLKEYSDIRIELGCCIKRSALFAAAGISGILLYLFSLRSYLKYSGLVLADYKGMDNMGKINIVESADKLRLLLKDMYFDSEYSLVGYSRWVNGRIGILINICILLSGLCWLIKRLYKVREKITVQRILLILLFTALVPVMWGIIAFMAPQASIHVLLMPQLTLIYLMFIAAVESTDISSNGLYQMGRFISIVAVVYVAFNYYLVASEYQYGLKLADNKAYALAAEINSRLGHMPYWQQGMKLAVVGSIDTWSLEPGYYGIYGKNECLFWPGYGSQGCWQKYILEKLGVYYTICTLEEYTELVETEEFANLDYFPHEKSIGIINDTVVVKLGDDET